jgi:hypothetical protein
MLFIYVIPENSRNVTASHSMPTKGEQSEQSLESRRQVDGSIPNGQLKTPE